MTAGFHGVVEGDVDRFIGNLAEGEVDRFIGVLANKVITTSPSTVQ